MLSLLVLLWGIKLNPLALVKGPSNTGVIARRDGKIAHYTWNLVTLTWHKCFSRIASWISLTRVKLSAPADT